MKYALTDFGRSVKVKLVEIGRNQNWLIEQCKEKTGLFIDSSLLNRVLTGRSNSNRVLDAIKEILDL